LSDTNGHKRRIFAALIGAATGMCAVAMYVGGMIGWEQREQWPAWLGVPMGIAMGPMYLWIDVMDLLQGSYSRLIALPQSLPGGLVGGLLGWWFSRRR